MAAGGIYYEQAMGGAVPSTVASHLILAACRRLQFVTHSEPEQYKSEQRAA